MASGAIPPDEPIDWKALRKRAAANPPPEVGAMLEFAQHDLMAIIERLSSFAIAVSTGSVALDRNRNSAARLGTRLSMLASMLQRQSGEAWTHAARYFKGRRGKVGWSQTCWNIGLSERARQQSRIVADRLDDAGTALHGCGSADTAATVAHLARRAAEELLRASVEWNALNRFQQSADRAAQLEQEHPELQRFKPPE